MSDEPILHITRTDLDLAIEKATTRALKELGLDDANAPDELRELRQMLRSWHEVRKSALQAVVKVLTTALLGAILLGLGIKLGGSGILNDKHETPPVLIAPAVPATAK